MYLAVAPTLQPGHWSAFGQHWVQASTSGLLYRRTDHFKSTHEDMTHQVCMALTLGLIGIHIRNVMPSLYKTCGVGLGSRELCIAMTALCPELYFST